jgi:uncharacterized protein with HEPN domain
MERAAPIALPKDFLLTPEGTMRLESVCMLLVVTGETVNTIDKKTGKAYLAEYPSIDWPQVIGLRNIIAHHYFKVDEELIFHIVKEDVPELLSVIRKMIDDFWQYCII